MKKAVIFYHKNIHRLYRQEWIDQCVDSMAGQSDKDFDVFELNYGGGNERYAEGKFARYTFLNMEFNNHIGAMNYLYSMLFANGYDVVFNTNMDDYYDLWRVEEQMKFINTGCQLVSSDFVYINEFGHATKLMNVSEKGDIKENLNKDHNVIAHPAVAMHKSFWDDDLHYNDLIGHEDLDLWQRAVKKGKTLFIVPKPLLLYRIHREQITSTLKRKKVNLMMVATGKYTQFVEPLVKSAMEKFLPNHDVTYCLFTDNIDTVNVVDHSFMIENGPWPHATLKRFHFFKRYENHIPKADYFFYIDVDTLITGEIGDEILSDITVVQHCGFVGRLGTYETRPESTSYVRPGEGKQYYGGGFWGMSEKEFWIFVDQAVFMIDRDQAKGITPVHNDESVLNKYMTSFKKPTKVLTPSYHYPQGNIEYYKKIWKRDYECKILLLDKNHEEVRS